MLLPPTNRPRHGPIPTIPGFSPDPSICVVDGTFYLVTSSFHLFPGLPIYSSTDLRSWKLVGHAIHRSDQLSLRHSDTELPTSNSSTIATGGLWAPTIRHHAGVTYVVCTNVVYRNGRTDSTRRNFIVRTSDILSGQWSDPLYFDFDGIDPSLFFDDDGKTYIQICAHPRGGIWQFEVDLNTAKALTTPVLLWEGWDRRFTEGPHVYKKDGYYYLLVAEGGTFEDHMISIARGDSIHGPFEPCPNNPLLTTKGTDGYLQHVGHGDIFQDAEGSWWTVLLGVVRTGDRYPLGRETFLAKVDWPEKEWPKVHELEGRGCEATLNPGLFEDNSFVHLRDADLSTYTIGDRQLVLSASTSDLSSHKDTISFAGRRQLRLDGLSSVTLHVQTLRSTSLKAGICVYKDEHRFAALGFDSGTSQMYFEARNAAIGYLAEARTSVDVRDRVHLCIDYTHLEWNFRYRVGGSESWIKLGVVDTLQLSGRDFTGPILGVFVVGSEEDKGLQVRFEDVKL